MRAAIRMSVWGAALLLPTIAMVASTARSEFQAAVRLTPNLSHGEELFRTCAACHGTDGAGVPDGTVPAVAGQHFRFIIKQLVDYRHDKRWDIRMERFTDKHLLAGPQDLADVAAYVSGLPRKANAAHGTGDGLQRGVSVYFRNCESCHGPSGQGDEARAIPRLAGQHYEYLMRQFYDTVDGRRPNMDSEHVRLLSQLEREEIVGVSDYLSRLLPSTDPE
jgi:cytochrome c553